VRRSDTEGRLISGVPSAVVGDELATGAAPIGCPKPPGIRTNCPDDSNRTLARKSVGDASQNDAAAGRTSWPDRQRRTGEAAVVSVAGERRLNCEGCLSAMPDAAVPLPVYDLGFGELAAAGATLIPGGAVKTNEGLLKVVGAREERVTAVPVWERAGLRTPGSGDEKGGDGEEGAQARHGGACSTSVRGF